MLKCELIYEILNFLMGYTDLLLLFLILLECSVYRSSGAQK